MAKKCKYGLGLVISGPMTGREGAVACKSPNRPQEGNRGYYRGYPVMGSQTYYRQWYCLCMLGKYEDVTPSKCKFYK